MLLPTFYPRTEVVQRYAEVLVRFAPWGGQGVKPGDVVQCVIPEIARQFYVPLRDEILRAGAHPVMDFRLMDVNRSMYEIATVEQLGFTPQAIERGMVEDITVRITIMPLEHPHELAGVNPDLVQLREDATRSITKSFAGKQARGLSTRTLASWGSEELAREVGLSLEEYWQQIEVACYLDGSDPIARWRETFHELHRICAVLNRMEIDSLVVTGDDIELAFSLGANRKWIGGSGGNIPSYEIYTSPDWRSVSGWVRFNLPLYNSGVRIENIYLKFLDGVVVESSASSNEETLRAILAQDDASKIGEFALVDGRHSNITHPMARTVFDENMGGLQGSTHIALGSAYKSTYSGDASKVSDEVWKSLGFNNPNATHVDVVSTTRREVRAYLKDDTQRLIYADGNWRI